METDQEVFLVGFYFGKFVMRVKAMTLFPRSDRHSACPRLNSSEWMARLGVIFFLGVLALATILPDQASARGTNNQAPLETPSATVAITRTLTWTATPLALATSTALVMPTRTATVSPTVTSLITKTAILATPTRALTATPTVTRTIFSTATLAATPTLTRAITPTATVTATVMLTGTITGTLTATPTLTSTNVLTTDQKSLLLHGNVIGKILLQGRSDANGVVITANNGVTTTTSAGNPNFSLALPAGTYTITVSMPRYIPIRLANVQVRNGETMPLVFGALAAGDANGDGKVDVLDLSLVGGDFGKTMNYNPGADINGDGVVNIFDLVLIASNLGVSSGSTR